MPGGLTLGFAMHLVIIIIIILPQVVKIPGVKI